MQNSLNLDSSEVISTYVYKTGLLGTQYSFSAAVGLFDSIVNFILLVTVNRIAKTDRNESLVERRSSGMHSRSRADRVFDLFNYAFLTLLLIVILYPLYFIIIASVSDPISVSGGKVWLFPVDFTLEGYQRIMENQTIWVGYKIRSFT